MPRREKGNRGRGKGRRNNTNTSRITAVPFHNLFGGTLSGVTGIINYTMQPQTSPLSGLAEIADQFDLFKISRLSYRIFPMDPSYTTSQGLCFYPDVDIQTQTIAQLTSSPLAAVNTPFNGVPSSWIHVPASQLKGMLDWYKCTADAGAAEFESQGILQACGGLGDTITFEIRGVMLFKNPCSSALMVEHTLARLERLGLVARIPPKEKEKEETPTVDRKLCIAQRRRI